MMLLKAIITVNSFQDLIKELQNQRGQEILREHLRPNGRAAGADPRKVARLDHPGLNGLKSAHREPRNGSLSRLIADALLQRTKGLR